MLSGTDYKAPIYIPNCKVQAAYIITCKFYMVILHKTVNMMAHL